MEYRQLGNSGLQISEIGLGTNNFGRRVDADGTARVMA
jgi:aryl-alcohol dehydrogenase-like predicted oxidoreductase